MSTKNKYTSEFKKSIVNLYHSGKSYSQIHTKYGVSLSALSKWVKLYSEVKIDDDTIITAQQIKELQSYKSSFKATFGYHSLQSSPCKQKYILQMD